MNPKTYLALSGGVGGAKLAAGLAQVLRPESLTIAVNVGDDFEHLGLTVCPDLDTVLYTLSGVVHPQQGWGRADESFKVMNEIRRLGGADWFTLGDLDIALHLRRRQLLAEGRTLTEISFELARRLGVSTTVVPVSDSPIQTWIVSDQDRLAFQDYFVKQRCAPKVTSLEYVGANTAALNPVVRAVLSSPDLAGVILCPSNPYLSVAPMLAIVELRERLRALKAPVIAVSPIVAGDAVKGPAAKIMRELGIEPRADLIADLYADFVDKVVIDAADAPLAEGCKRLAVTNTVMKSNADRIELARHCVALAQAFEKQESR